MTALNEITGHARRATFHDAGRAFAEGATVLVSETGTRETIPVTRLTTTHTRDTTTWDALVEQVRMWRNRYPGQAFYIVDRPEPAPAAPAETPAQSDGMESYTRDADPDVPTLAWTYFQDGEVRTGFPHNLASAYADAAHHEWEPPANVYARNDGAELVPLTVTVDAGIYRLTTPAGVEIARFTPQPAGPVRCDTCGDESNSDPGLTCGRVDYDEEQDESGAEYFPPCAGIYLPVGSVTR
ncbi:hypothetical protein ABN028_19560 [Actinopolymorpha sp. B17G11]|uniref:hypothetical protein n=1 Tax=Actinopolymorpha sp. B17G11 TaxID=3160861 RepID=UPI0032E3B905